MTAIEAFVNKKIVIASEEGGLKELISEGNNGYLFKTGDCIDLAKKIDIAISNSEEKMKKMQAYARERAIKLYNSQSYYNKIMHIYCSAIENH